MKLKNQDVRLIDIIWKHVFRKSYLSKKMGIMLLCIIHEFTKYKTCRNFSDLFYWPDGFCIDTVIIIAFFMIAAWSVWDDLKIMSDIK